MQFNSYDSLLSLNNIAIKAGEIIMNYYKKNKNITFKEDRSPLTEADLASNSFILDALKKFDFSIPILTEETLVAWPKRKKWESYWLVDPLDGTKEFINQNDEFTVNIALIKNNIPILGIIYAPALSVLYFGIKNKGSFKIICKRKINSLSESIKLKVNIKKNNEKFNIFESRSHSNKEFNLWVKQNYQNYELIKRGSSIKFCEIAEGKADVYPRFGPTNEWDIAAGHIILNEAGGSIESIDGKEILYNKKENILNSYFIASCKLNN
ncbi:3'(2'),5'-bisphosphate nucleotidase CysQ [Alphaproteobacteria bacterium]|nr:3'(2'),5'-bisphosphate nucleotidase CysQ [Alphaproteobacteria bacterium]